jgi:MoxR-like ATPase
MTNKAPALTVVPSAVPTAQQWATLERELNALFPERREIIRAMIAAMLAGEHVFLLGPAGTGKSALARACSQAFQLTYYEHLLTKFTTPSEMFGEVDLPAWQSTGVYARNVKGFAPEARVWFLDEVWKGSSAIVNALLAALNERRFRNGGTMTPLPLLTCISASNELPEGEGLDPIYDRFLVRCEVNYIVEDDAWTRMLQAPDPVPPTAGLDLEQEQAACARVVVPSSVVECLRRIANAVRAAGYVASDRRYKRAVKLIKASAYLDGRTEAEPEDLEILEHVLWREPKERAGIARIIQEHASPSGAVATERLDEARELWRNLSGEAKSGVKAKLGELSSCLDALDKIAGELAKLPDGRRTREARAEVTNLHGQVAKLAASAFGVKL